MSRANRGRTNTLQLMRMREVYLKDSAAKLRDLNDKISALEAEVGPYIEKVHALDKLYCCLHKEQRRYDKLLKLHNERVLYNERVEATYRPLAYL